jgi:hypothetical protein
MSDIEADLLLLRLGLGVGMAEGVSCMASTVGDLSSYSDQSSLSIVSVCSIIYSSSALLSIRRSKPSDHATCNKTIKTRDNSG